MNDYTLEEQLKNEGAEQAKAFFARTDMAALRARVIRRARPAESAPRRISRGMWLRAGAAAALALALIAAAFIFIPPASPHPESAEISKQSVSLDDSGTEYEVSFIPVDVPQGEPGLLSVLWQTELEGNPRLIYTGLFESSNEAYPATTLVLPGESRRALLLSSGNKTRNILHYRLIYLTPQGMATLWSQEYVSMGRLDIKDGIIVERRSATEGYPSFAAGEERMQTSYIVPLGMLDIHTIALPLNRLELHVGDAIMFISGMPSLSASSQSGVMQPLAQERGLYGGFVGVKFFAASIGEDVLTLSGGQDSESEQQLILSVRK